jgi:dihydrofolate reductase
MNFTIIAAIDQKNGIGKNNSIPWHLPEDLRYFQSITTGTQKNGQNVIIMGRITWESIPKNYRPLKNRINIVVSSQNVIGCDHICRNLDQALSAVKEMDNVNEVFVIGGEMLYCDSINRKECKKMYITMINYDFECDRFFPEIDLTQYQLRAKSLDYIGGKLKYNFLEYQRL